MSEGTRCESCGHVNSGDAMFCSKCGARLEAPAADASAPSEPPAPEPSAPEAPQAAEVVPETRDHSRTVEAPVPDFSGHEKAKPKRIAGAAKTMLGMPMPDAAAVAAAKAQADAKKAAKAEAEAKAEEAPAAPPAKVAGGRTMLGMPSPQEKEIQEAVARARRDKEPAPAPNFTQPDPAAAQPPAPKADAPAPAKARALDPQTNRTMLGQPAPKRASERPPQGIPKADSARNRAAVVYPSTTGEEDAMTLPAARPASKLPYVVLGMGVLVLLLGGGALLWAFMSSGSDLNASVVLGESGEMLEIVVPGAEPGTQVRFHGEEQALEAGVARFEVSADDLRLGDNELSVDVVSPDGDVESHTVSLHLEMRIRADLGPLASVPPAIEVIVEAPAGSTAQLDGEALELDGQGRGSRRYDIDGGDASAEGVVEHVVRYVVHPPEGDTAQGELRTRIPLTTMQLDRPGTRVVTDQTSVEVAGAVSADSVVTVGGQTVTVTEGRFVHRHEIPQLGEQTLEVIARAPGKAPHVMSIEINRVADLAEEAARFEHNEALTYARIAQNPATYRGQRVRFEGLVYNVEVSGGRSVLQMLAAGCARGERCPLWITLPSATDVENQDRVVVLGTVAGEQQFRSQSGQIRTVPRVDATFILPAPAGGRR